MSLKDHIAAAPARKPTGFPCSVGQLLKQMPEDEVRDLRAMLYELGWSGSTIYDALVAEGYSVGAQSINRHRSKACRCFASQQ